MKLSVAALVVSLVGCVGGGQAVWHRNNTTRTEFDADRLQCQYEAEKATASYSAGQTARGVNAAAAQGMFEGLEIGNRQRALVASCLRARGYVELPLR